MIKKFNFGFTLTEILITLGVIGVVAAITMPILIKNCQKTVWVNQLKTNYNLLNQVYKNVMTSDNIESLTDLIDPECDHYENTEDATLCYKYVSTDIASDLARYILKGAKWEHVILDETISIGSKYKNYYRNGVKKVTGDLAKSPLTDYSDNHDFYGLRERFFHIIELTNGSMFYIEPGYINSNQETCNKIRKAGGHMCTSIAYLTLDVNGKKGPNTHGRDIFRFVITDSGSVVPRYGRDEVIFLWFNGLNGGIPEEAMFFDTDALVRDFFNINNLHEEINNIDGCASLLNADCTSFLIEFNNWKMDY